MISGFTNGCFDCLHEGHRHFLRECKKQCDFLWIGINSDSSVKKLKGEGRPVQKVSYRVDVLVKYLRENFDFSDFDYRIFDTEAHLEMLIRDLKPDILFKGEDYKHKTITGAQYAKKVELIPLLAGYSTTKVIAGD